MPFESDARYCTIVQVGYATTPNLQHFDSQDSLLGSVSIETGYHPYEICYVSKNAVCGREMQCGNDKTTAMKALSLV
jgi:hypothetical protein